MAQRATSLGPKPSLFFFCFLFFFFFLFGGFKGQVRWPEGPPHLALNPPYLFLLLFRFFLLFFWLSNTKKTCFSPRKGHFLFIFSVSLSFSLSLFWPPYFCVSLSLSLFFLFFSSFLSLFLLSFGSLFLSLSFLFLSFLLFFHERNNIKRINCKFFVHQFFISFFGFLSFFFHLHSFCFPLFKRQERQQGLLYFFPLLFLFFVVFLYFCVSRFSCYSSFISLTQNK